MLFYKPYYLVEALLEMLILELSKYIKIAP